MWWIRGQNAGNHENKLPGALFCFRWPCFTMTPNYLGTTSICGVRSSVHFPQHCLGTLYNVNEIAARPRPHPCRMTNVAPYPYFGNFHRPDFGQLACLSRTVHGHEKASTAPVGSEHCRPRDALDCVPIEHDPAVCRSLCFIARRALS
ncbi:hypothetical protein PUNSTDRAFT_121854 [Punctularia strigosozonata HHB-11173 SS5]|uniref:uncharacterized protein n=1 Tax=Punctularia strigosozonata (strain HHB-11173) TaxID=741275 RepID=UPI000441637B|nr:uncharacterized protein PUNSTDRAFT_121854 [Punctularia strigosozonata HHB-11173 SS5]EIN06760.1 hypothetical protein PUNSTDRAFT_121854 [Punctularia strigosozonata HHB-11173 SS5]